MNALQPTVARGLLRTLSGFRGYPRGEGETRFVDVLCEISLSVEHAASTLLCFDADFPTIRELRDAALNLRPKFEAKVDQRAQWEREYGKPDADWSRRFTGAAAGTVPNIDPKVRKQQYQEERRAMLWQAIRDSLYYTEGPGRKVDQFWAEAAAKHKRNHPAEVAAFRIQLDESGWDVLMAVDWLKSMPKAPVRQQSAVAVLERPIRQTDIDAELRKAGREPGDDGDDN